MGDSWTSRVGYVIGVQFGGVGMPTSIAVIERMRHVVDDQPQPTTYGVVHLHQAQGPYTDQIDVLHRLRSALLPAKHSPSLIADLTAVGRPVAKELRKAGIHSCNVSVSEGANETGDGDFNFSIPRNNLGSALAVVLDAGRLRIAKDMPAASALAAELESARDGAIGGLSLPVALVTWWCERKASVPLHIINNLFGSIS